jgi:hypothetical protein
MTSPGVVSKSIDCRGEKKQALVHRAVRVLIET